jgi:hypothetical protein
MPTTKTEAIITTFTISVESGNSYPSVKAEFHGASIADIRRAIEIALEAFRTVEVVCEQTGEVYYNCYIADDLFIATDAYGSVIDRISKLLYA